MTEKFGPYLTCDSIVDTDHPEIRRTAERFRPSAENNTQLIKNIFEWVRDRIHHTFDIQGNLVTAKASEVLFYHQGICYAKSILLAALLRSLHIPAGFGYQKLILDDEKYPWHVLHGYNFVYLSDDKKWIKLDARGNKEGVHAVFSTQKESLAFPVRTDKLEADENINHPAPKPQVIDCLLNSRNREELIRNLPREF